jgi:excinuclease UvrABC helicase subunit UvrB
MSLFNLQAPFEPGGYQPEAIAQLTKSLQQGNRFQTLLGATGTGKTFSVANLINNVLICCVIQQRDLFYKQLLTARLSGCK